MFVSIPICSLQNIGAIRRFHRLFIIYDTNSVMIDIREDAIKAVKRPKKVKLRELSPVDEQRLLRYEKDEARILEVHPTLIDQEQVFVNSISSEYAVIEQPTELKTKLLDFQLRGVSWMVNRENSIVKGGILADEMGMGKTLQAIGLMLASKGTTLIVAPAISISQWQKEMSDHAPDAFEVVMYHGRQKKTSNDLDKGVLAATLRKYTRKAKSSESLRGIQELSIKTIEKEKCVGNNASDLKNPDPSDSLHFSQRFSRSSVVSDSTDEESNEKSRSDIQKNSDSTQILQNSFNSFSNSDNLRCANILDSAVDDFANRPFRPREKVLVVITTYSTLESAYRRKERLLFDAEFTRIILDEAHCIKDSKSNACTAVTAIKADYRWALTGTPVQNRVGDLFSLVKFLGLDPHSYYFCKKCPCKTRKWLNYDKKTPDIRTGFCTCGHFSASHFGWWNRRITSLVKNFGYTTKAPQIFESLQKITSHIILRRTKSSMEAELGLPSKVVSVSRLYFSDQELDFYESLFKNTQNKFMSYAIAGQINNNYAHIFDLLQKMRMAVNHPHLAMKNVNDGIPICGLCNEEADDPVISDCKHIFCRLEAKEVFINNPLCPVCKVRISIDFSQNTEFKIPKSKINTRNWTSSTKIEALVQELSNLKSKSFAKYKKEPLSASLKAKIEDFVARKIEKSLSVIDEEIKISTYESCVDNEDLDQTNRIGNFTFAKTAKDPEFLKSTHLLTNTQLGTNSHLNTPDEDPLHTSTLASIQADDCNFYKLKSNNKLNLESYDHIEKSIVFSQFVNFLELLRWRLERAGFRCVTIYGSMNISQRRAAIHKFNTDPDITVFLISLKAGGVALNLTEANNVFMMDLWWNPAVEEQAMDRIHRIGQHRPIKIKRLIIENSIESKILLLQEKKKALFDSAVDCDVNALQRLSEDDLMFLFSN